jgi:mRNA-degrading endonuclease toxin of MazEF toxin-antitoxin module
MINAGDTYLADLTDERRRRVLVISNDRFHRVAGRALVAPEIIAEPDEVSFPWRVQVDGAMYAVDMVRSLPVKRLLDRTGRAPAAAMAAVRRALLNIT